MLDWRKILLSLAIAASLLYSPTVRSESYSGVSGIDLHKIHSFDGVQNTYRLKYKYFSINKESDRSALIEKIIEKTSNIVFEYLRSNNILLTRCSHNHFIFIYEISSLDLNNNDRFLKTKYYPNSSFIYGFWEPIDNNNDVIVTLYSNSNELFSDIISHEVAHYWYNRLNLSKVIDKTHEEFALMVERRYKGP